MCDRPVSRDSLKMSKLVDNCAKSASVNICDSTLTMPIRSSVYTVMMRPVRSESALCSFQRG